MRGFFAGIRRSTGLAEIPARELLLSLSEGTPSRREGAMIVPLLQKERSIDDFVDRDEGCRLAALLADTESVNQEDELYTLEVRRLVRHAMVQLDDRERHIIRNRFGLLGGKELTLEEIGKTLNLSRERVRQLEREAKDKLRANLERFHPQIRFSLV
jgi:RNA polymerase sigma factor (sigma-70 family)